MASFSELLAAARDGCPNATRQLYDNYARRLFTVVRRRIGSRLRQKFDSTDLVQSVFVEVLRDLPRIEDRGEVAFRHWLYIKTESKVRSKMRKFFRFEEHELGETPLHDEGDSPVTGAARREGYGHARRLYDRLDAASREVIVLRLEQELSYAAIAERLGLASAEAARKRYTRAIARLREVSRTGRRRP